MTKDLEARERVRSRLMAAADQQFPQAWVRVTRLELGPPVGYPVQFRVVGPDTQVVRQIAREVEKVVASSPKVRDVQLDWNDPVRTMKVELDQDKARALGLTPADVSLVTQTVMNGATLSQLREREDLIDIVARAVPERTPRTSTRSRTSTSTRARARWCRCRRWRSVRYELEEPVLWRRNRDMAITVRADVKDGEQGVSVTQEIRPLLKDIEAKLPSGYRIDVGGAVEESDKANKALLAVAPLMLVAILLLLMLQLQGLLADVDGGADRAAGPDRRGAGAAGVPGAARLRGDPGHHRAGRHDHAQLGDPDRPGAHRDRRRAAMRGTPCWMPRSTARDRWC